MKRFIFIIIILASVGCNKIAEINTITDIDNGEETYQKIFYALAEDSQSKVTLVPNQWNSAVKHLAWNEGDEISVFLKNTSNAKYKFDGKDGDKGGTFSYVSSNSAPHSEISTVYAVYPYSEDYTMSSDECLTVSVPSHQRYYPDSFDPAANVMVAVADTPESDTLKFYSKCSYLIFQVYGNASIKSIILSDKPGYVVDTLTAKFLPQGNMEFKSYNNGATQVTLDCGDGVKLGTAESPTQFCVVVNQTAGIIGLRLYITDTQGRSMFKIKEKIRFNYNNIYTFPPFEFMGKEEEIIEIEDPYFKRYCIENFDINGDGEISNVEAEQVDKINLSGIDADYIRNISSFKGIEHFCNLADLSIQRLDKVTELDLRDNKLKLKSLLIKWSSLETLELDCPELEHLELAYLDIESLTTSSLKSLKEFKMYRCYNIEGLSFGVDAPVSTFYCNNCPLKMLDISRLKNLTELTVGNTEINSIDLSNNISLTSITCSYNQLTSLLLGKRDSLNTLICSFNKISNIDVSSLLSLVTLDLEGNPLSTLDISNCPRIESLGIESTNIEEIDLSNNQNIIYLGCYKSKLSTLDVSNCSALRYLYCSSIPTLKEIWLAEKQYIPEFEYDPEITTIKYKTGRVLKPEAIDLGLSVKWASFNLGAFDITQSGTPFAWGETETKAHFGYANYKFYSHYLGPFDTYYISKYNYLPDEGVVDSLYTLEAVDDAAQVQWGDGWRMPTLQEAEELLSNCDCKDTTINGVNGLLFTSRITGFTNNSVFFLCSKNLKGIWTSSLYVLPPNTIMHNPSQYAYYILLIDFGYGPPPMIYHNNRKGGNLIGIRPVHP